VLRFCYDRRIKRLVRLDSISRMLRVRKSKEICRVLPVQ
jgi:hypothetical protein